MKKQRKIGYMTYYGKGPFTMARRLFGHRWFLVHKDWNVYRYVLGQHFRGENRKGEKFVYCPVSLIVSWSPGDYEHQWCHACQLFFSNKVEQLLDPGEEYRKAA